VFRKYKATSSPLRSSKTSSPVNPPSELTPSSSESVDTSSRQSETDNADTESLASSSDIEYQSQKSFYPSDSSIPRQPSQINNQYLLNGEEIAEKYRKAIIHYSKYQNAGIIETEACFKAARIAVEQNNSLHASSFLQNVIFISLTLSEQEKIQRFDTLAELYKEIGLYQFHRNE
jgi:trafficking protein particle complex subunit 9